jgi:P-type Ca2+ transporter type 2C
MSVMKQARRPWQAMEAAELLDAVEARQEGLSAREAERRLEQFGPNKLPEKAPPTALEIFFRQFYSPLIFILAIAALVAVLIGDFKDAGFIAVVLLINALIGGYQEWKAEQSSRALQKLLHIRATVIRTGEAHEVDAEFVVPGDILLLETGNRVPADLRLLSAHGLEIDESPLTGESLAVLKQPEWPGDAKAPVADHKNMAYAGCVVIRGRGRGVVVATGADSMVGRLAVDVMETTGGQAPLIERMHGLARLVAIIVVVVASLLGVMGIAFHGFGETKTIFLFAVALAVAAIPEGLPAALTVALSLATTRMARRGVIVRRLAAVEGLGSCTLIASDKTGTLTCNELTVRQVHLVDGSRLEITGEGFIPEGEVLHDGQALKGGENAALDALTRAAVLCNEGEMHRREGMWEWRGDPTDVALLAMGVKLGWRREPLLERFPQVNEIPFEPEHRFSATFHRHERKMMVFVKGGPERVLSMCDLDSEASRSQELRGIAEEMAARGFRVLALAEGAVEAPLEESQSPSEPPNLQFLGFVGMIDPLRAGVREAVAACHEAGITVCMVTGDHPVTALAISRQLDLAAGPDQVISGDALHGKSPEDLEQLVGHTRVFARVAPRQKLELVEAAQRAGHFVAVTGDGVNDAPALRAANIGLAMGKGGTDVAREAAELVISDDNFSTIVAGIEEGRVAYDNVRKVVAQLTATGAAEVLLVSLALASAALMATAFGAHQPAELIELLPLLPVQLLWLNLVTNGIQGVALAFEPNEGDVLRRPPRSPQEPVFNRLMIERTLVAASVMSIVGIGIFLWTVQADWDMRASRNALLLFMVLCENVHVGNNRSETKSAFRLSPLRSPVLLMGVVLAFLVHVAAMHFGPLQAILETQPVDLSTWGTLAALALSVLAAMEIHKWTWSLRYGDSLTHATARGR